MPPTFQSKTVLAPDECREKICYFSGKRLAVYCAQLAFSDPRAIIFQPFWMWDSGLLSNGGRIAWRGLQDFDFWRLLDFAEGGCLAGWVWLCPALLSL